VTEERLAKLRAMLDMRQPDLTVLMESVNKPHNLSAILRTCDAVGVLGAHAVPPRRGLRLEEPSEELLSGKTYNDTSGSAAKWVDLTLHSDIGTAISTLKSGGFKIYATNLSSSSVDYRAVDYTAPSCILLGAEKWGISPEAAQLADAHIVIPMMGMVQSLNVSVAAAVILFEAQRQRLEAGFYSTPRLEPQSYQLALEGYLQRHAEGKG
jgi:tRNA (guanosine-2'-O-)-methyltransferase